MANGARHYMTIDPGTLSNNGFPPAAVSNGHGNGTPMAGTGADRFYEGGPFSPQSYANGGNPMGADQIPPPPRPVPSARNDTLPLSPLLLLLLLLLLVDTMTLMFPSLGLGSHITSMVFNHSFFFFLFFFSFFFTFSFSINDDGLSSGRWDPIWRPDAPGSRTAAAAAAASGNGDEHGNGGTSGATKRKALSSPKSGVLPLGVPGWPTLSSPDSSPETSPGTSPGNDEPALV